MARWVPRMSPAKRAKAGKATKKAAPKMARKASRPAKKAKAARPAKKAKGGRARPAARAGSPRPAPTAARPSGHAHCAATDPFGDPCQNVPRRPSAYCVIHSYLDR